jgi:hypothetical protein
MAVQELPPLVWRAFAVGRVQLSKDGTVATQMNQQTAKLSTIHSACAHNYWGRANGGQALLGSGAAFERCVGHLNRHQQDQPPSQRTALRSQLLLRWLVHLCLQWTPPAATARTTARQAIRQASTPREIVWAYCWTSTTGPFASSRMERVQHGRGYEAGSVTGPVAAAVQMANTGNTVHLLPNPQLPQE